MKKIVIIGGGIAGLSAGIHARLHGFEAAIYEKHSMTGGFCTGWDRQGYHIDGCIHWLTGTAPGSGLNKLWKTVGALENTEIIKPDQFGSYEFNGVTITLWRDLDRLQKELLALSPEDASQIKQMIADIRVLSQMDMPTKMPIPMLPLKEMIKLGASMKDVGAVMKQYSKLTCREYGKTFQHPALQKLFALCMPEGFSIFSFLFSLATFSCGNGDIPKDGSMALAKRMEQRFLDLGGTLYVNTPVKEILIEKNIVSGICLADGTVIAADYVIAACDTNYTFKKLLQNRYHDKKFEMRYDDQANYGLPTSIQLSFGLEGEVKEFSSSLSFETEPYKAGKQEYETLSVKSYDYDTCYAPSGKTLLAVNLMQTDADYLYWKQLYENKSSYREEKRTLTAAILQRMEDRFPQWKGKLTFLDMATPITFHRYTNAYHGAWMSFKMTPGSKSMAHSGKIKGLKNCYLSGQWLQPPGGLPTAVTMGKFTIQYICRQEKLPVT